MGKPTPGHGLWRPYDPNQKLYDGYAAAQKQLDTTTTNLNKKLKSLQDANKLIDVELHKPLDGLYAKKNQALSDGNYGLAGTIDTTIIKKLQTFSNNSDQIDKIKKELDAAQKAFEKKFTITPSSSYGAGNDTNTKGTDKVGLYHFNAPLVNSAYFLNKGDLPKMISAGPSITGDALKFWANTGGKGTIQMDRQTHNSATKAEAKKQAIANNLKFDDKMYGFKFQYNPTTVNMSWSGMMGANPVFEMLNKDPAIPITTNLFTGTLSFDIILNRIQDLALLTPNGTFKDDVNPYGTVQVPSTDLKDLAQKGTMYDLEYLFKSLHGWANSSFQSTLQGGTTNDPGWLPVRPVELHLGNKLRYRVRVSGLEVVHKIFSEKMIPLLSVVTITCNRYWDGPPAKDTKTTTKKK